jgi:protein-disulfide isomerase
VARRVENQVRYTYKIPAEVKISLSPLKASEFPNYDTITITMDGGDRKQTYDFLLSKDGQSLVRMTKLDLSKDPYAELMKKIDTNGRPVRGKKDAKVVAVNYDDFQCPFCSRMHQTLFPEILKEYGDRVAFIYKDFPLAEIHPWATRAAVNANCLAAQNPDAYWEFADYLHSHVDEMKAEKGRDAQFAALDKQTLVAGAAHNADASKLQACIKAQNEDAIKASVKEGKTLGVDATPTMFVNGEQVDGALPLPELRAVLDRALEQAGVQPPAHPAAPAAESKPQPASK